MAEDSPQLGVSVFQVFGSALAAVTAAVVASYFGVAGTVIGAAVASAVATAGTAIYSTSSRRANDRLLTLQVLRGRARRRPRPADIADVAVEGPGYRQAATTTAVAAGCPAEAAAGPSRGALVATVVVVFLLAMAAVTGVELLAGRPLSSLFGADHARRGTSVSGILGVGGSQPRRPAPAPTATAQASPTASSTRPLPGPSASPSPGASATATPTPAAGGRRPLS